MGYSRFNFGDYEPTYSSEEARICDFLTEVHNIISHEDYMKLFNALVNNDKKQLADILTNLYKVIKKRNEEISERKNRSKMDVQYYEKQIEEKNKQITELKDKVKVMSASKGENMAELEKMKDLYEQGHSLSEIGRILNKDKSTIKRKLVKMGVQIRNSSDAHDISGLLKYINSGD